MQADTPGSWLEDALNELRPVCQAIEPRALEELVAELMAARRVVTYGVGREGLMMRALCMRLMHSGLDAHVAGDMSTPAVGPGDLLIASAGPESSRRCWRSKESLAVQAPESLC